MNNLATSLNKFREVILSAFRAEKNEANFYRALTRLTGFQWWQLLACYSNRFRRLGCKA